MWLDRVHRAPGEADPLVLEGLQDFGNMSTAGKAGVVALFLAAARPPETVVRWAMQQWPKPSQ